MSEQTSDLNNVNQAVELLEGLLERMSFAVKIEGEEVEDKLLLQVECEEESDTQKLIGRRGQVIDAIQHLVNKMVSRERTREERGKPVIVDIGGYRQRHIEKLETIANDSVDKVKETGESVHLNPMSAYDRRIVHMQIAELGGVETQSEGQGERRHIVVLPN